LPLREKSRLETLKNKLLQYASIKGVSFSNSGTASGSILFGDYVFHDAEENKKGQAQVKLVDKDFPSVYELEFLYGQVPFPTDSLQQYIVNQAFAQEVGYGNNYDKLSGKFINIRRREGPIVAIVKDFHTTSLRKKVEPVIIMIEENYRRAGIKIRMQNISQALATIEEVWSSVYPEYVFEYIFLDERIANFYEDDRRTASLINLFTSMAIAIGCMGLLGLVSHMAVTRTKEIGIRKVLGATFSDIFFLLSKELTVLILIAFAIAAPVGYSLMQNWLTNFAYRIDLDASLFLYAMVASFVIAFITVAYKAILTAAANPVENLRSE
ncbi:MAG: ABC transporter permease, partial [Nitrososphaera sp.]